MSGSVVHPKEIYPQKKFVRVEGRGCDYSRLIESYREWLQALNYNQGSIKYGPKRVEQFLEYARAKNIEEVSNITAEVVQDFFEALGKHTSKQTGRGLSVSTLRGYQTEIKRFSRYLYETRQGHIEVSVKLEASPRIRRNVFSQSEIKRLYESCDETLLGIRDRAMLSIYYGCGLRRNEGVHLEIKDIEFKRAMVYVRKGKNYKERYVPMVGRVMYDLQNYLLHSRPQLANEQTENCLFVGYRGESIGDNMMGERLNKLKREANITKPGGLHSLRHSIATHLLTAGMSLEQIARFLGHSSLESTQIYTHLVNEQI